MTATQADTVAELQRTIAELRQELAARDAALAQRNAEYRERIEHQAATVDVLKAMSASPDDPQPVFDLIVERARDLCDAHSAGVYGFDGTLVQLRAATGVENDPERLKAFTALYPRPPTRDFHPGRAILDRKIVRIDDVESEPSLSPLYRGFTNQSGVAVPLLLDGVAIGALGLGRRERGGFSDSQVALLQIFAEQAVIAIGSTETYRELQERTAALATRNSEYGERIEQQSATIDVLKVMSASPGDPQPVFDLIATRARDLCDAYGVAVFEFDGTLIHWRAATGVSDDPTVRGAAQAMFPMAPTREWGMGRAILERRVIRIDDLETEPGLNPALRAGTAKSGVAVPLMRGDAPIGALAMGSREKGGFSDSQVELLKTFAEQAAIAITSAETYRALQTRTSDLQETLEYQTATSDLLKVISGSGFALEPVFQAVVDTAVRLCRADNAVIFRLQDDAFRWAAGTDLLPEYERRMRAAAIRPGTGTLIGRVAMQGRPVHIIDEWTDPLYRPKDDARTGGMHTSLGVPLLRDGVTIGAIGLGRLRVEPFTDRQIELVATFADQAVIAIENARLLTEQREALEQQTATAEVLQVINTNPGNLTPVFDAVLEKAMRLCGAAFGSLYTYDGERFHSAALRGVPPAFAAFRAENPPLPTGGLATLLETRRPQQVLDMSAHETYRPDNPGVRAMVELGGARTILSVPLIKEDVVLGFISIFRQEVRAYSEKEIALLQNFATQAVIAMENARLIAEQREALEQQTATAEVLQVINASPGNLVPVFDAILVKAHNLCSAAHGSLYITDGEAFRAVAVHGMPDAFADLIRRPFRPGPNHPVRQLLAGTPFAVVHDATEVDDPIIQGSLKLAGMRSALFVPLRKDKLLLGYIVASSPERRVFTEKQVALLQNFASQAVIAMENARLIHEQREALEQQTATAEVLQVINASPGDLKPVFDTLLEKAMRLCGGTIGGIYSYNGQGFATVALLGVTPAFQEYDDKYPMREVRPGSLPARMIETRGPVQNPDVLASETYRAASPYARALAELGGIRAVLNVPLLKEGALQGFIAIYRQEVGAFSDKQIVLLENFAAQAVIAMENARLLTEQQEALEQQTATAEVLQVINASPGNLTPVFDALLEKAMRLCEAAFGSLYTYDGARFHSAAQRGVPAAYAGLRERTPPSGQSGGPATRILQTQRTVHILDLMSEEAYQSGHTGIRALVELGGARTILGVPLLKDNTILGYISIYRQEVRAFSEKQIALLQSFAAQAVIAMENARLINETHEALEQQTATAEVLGVINSSPGYLGPVFDAILEKAHALCGAATGSLQLYDGEFFRAVATRGLPDEYANILRQPRRSDLRVALLRDAPFVQIADIADPVLTGGDKTLVAASDSTGVRTLLRVPLRKDDALLGLIVAGRREVRPFSQKEISLLQSFAAQAVIAMENARLLDEIRQRQAELRTTFDNMGDGVAMFDADLRLAAWNRNFQQIIDLPDALLRERPRYADYMRLLAERGEFGATGIEAELRQRIEDTDKELRLERVRPDGRVIEVRRNAVSGGGFVLIYSDITERKRSEEEIRAARDAAETALCELKTAQANLIQAEKMASLGQLTAGIAHEIKNPLNFVNNFASLSVDLLSELKETAGFAVLSAEQHAEVEDLSAMLTSNLEKIAEHGKRADGIVKAMLEHSRGASGERREVDINALADEALNLAYHGARAQDQSFNVTLERNFGAGIAPLEVNPQDITRVLLNIFSNGFYAATRRARNGGDDGFVPRLKVTTRDASEAVEIRVRDNGTGIPSDIRDKLFQPFFTTKPTGEGTGLGLSITYDIVTQQHGGTIAVDSMVGDYSEFTIRLPRNP